MPDRIIREDIITSEAVNSLSWLGEVFYRRLLNKLDDAGRYEARPELLRSSLFPLKTNQVSTADIVKLLNECVRAELVRCYEVGGKQYLEVHKFGQKNKWPKVKYPAPGEEKRREVEIELEVENEGARSFKKFYLRGHEIQKDAGEWLFENFAPRIDADFSTKFRGLEKEIMLSEFSSEAFMLHFREETHVYNSFKKYCEKKLTNGKSNTTTNQQGRNIGRVNEQTITNFLNRRKGEVSQPQDIDG